MAAMVVVAGLLAYASSLHGPLVFDDFGAIGNNPTIRQLSAAMWRALPDTPLAGRPLVNASFAVNVWMAGGVADLVGLHATNLAIHLVCGLLLFGVLVQTLRAVPSVAAGRAEGLAGAIAVLWIVHPINSETVIYLTQRTELMMGASFLAAVYAAARSHTSVHPRSWQIAAVAACVLGALCKETIAVAPLVIVAWDRIFMYKSWPAAFAARGKFYAALATTWGVLAALLVVGGQSVSAGFATAGISPLGYFANQPAMVLRYLWLMVWPQALVFYYGWPIRHLTLAAVWPQALGVLVLVALSTVLLVKRPRAGFAALCVWLILAPTSTVIPIATEVGAERRMYLPAAAVIALAVIGAVQALQWLQQRQGRSAPPRVRTAASGFGAGAVIVAVVAAALGARTYVRAAEFSSALRLAEITVQRWPSPNAHYLYGVELASAGRHDAAITQLTQALPGYPTAHLFLGTELLAVQRVDEGIAELQAFLAVEKIPEAVARARSALARAYVFKQDNAKAIEQLQLMLSASPSDADAHGLLADLLAGDHRFVEAIPHYQAFLAARPRVAQAWTGLGVAFIASNELGQAINAFQQAVAAEPENPHYQENLQRALAAAKR